jgi:hypothetical protein
MGRLSSPCPNCCGRCHVECHQRDTGAGRHHAGGFARQFQAIDYALKRWEALTRFIADGTLEIDNNLIENAIRPGALGEQNFLFLGHPEAGEHSAVISTLLGGCRRHGLNPFNYLKDLFTRLPAAKITEIKQFTPATWAKANASEKMVAQAG